MDKSLSEQMKEKRKITKWKNEPTVRELKQDLKLASSSHSAQMEKIKKWNELRDVSGTEKFIPPKGRSSIQPKLIRKQNEWRYSALTEPFHSSHKLFNVYPVTFEDAEAAKQSELLLNWQVRTKMNRISLIDDIVRTTVDDGTCIVRVGWHLETQEETEDVPIWEYYPVTEEEEILLIEEAFEFSKNNPRHFEEEVSENLKEAVWYFENTGEYVSPVQVGSKQEVTTVPVENYPTVEVMDPRDVFIDPTCEGDFDKALFVINKFVTTRSYLYSREDIYKNLDLVNWGDIDNEHQSIRRHENLEDISRKRITVYEYWGYYDVEDNGTLVPIVASWVGNTMIRMEENPFPDGKPPFVLIPYMPVKRELYGESDAVLLEDNQKTLGAIMRGILDLLGRSANGQRGIAKGLLDSVNHNKFTSDEDYEFNPFMNPTTHIVEHKYPEIPQSAIIVHQMQNEEAESLTGVKSFSGGVSGSAYGDVAAGIRGALDAASKREMAILRRIAEGVRKVGLKIVGMNSEFLSKEEIIRVTNREFVSITREDIKGNFDLEIDIATAEVDEVKAQNLGFMMQTIGPNVDQKIVFKMIAEILDLYRMPHFAEEIRSYEPEPSEQELELFEMEKNIKQLEMAKLQSEIQYNTARAAYYESQAGKTGLDIQEQHTGLKHEREMEKHKAQAQGNMELKKLEAEIRLKEKNLNDLYNEAGRRMQESPFYDPGSALNSGVSTFTEPIVEEENSLQSPNHDPKKDRAMNQALNLR